MKKLSVIFLMLFMGISTANAAVIANPNVAANANPNATPVDPLRGDLTALLAQGFSIEEIIAQLAGGSSPYAITEILGALTEVAGPAHYDTIYAQAQIYAPTFAPVIQEVINLYKADLAQGGVPGTIDPTAAFAAAAAGPNTKAGNSAIDAAILSFSTPQLNNSTNGIVQAVSPG